MPTEYDNVDVIGTTHESSRNNTEIKMNNYYHMQELATVNDLLKRIKFSQYDQLIDLGCSIGTWYNDYKNMGFKRIIGIDISKERLQIAKKRKINVLKIDIRVGFQANATLMLHTEKFLNEVYGFKKIGNNKIVAGGYLGKKGDIVVDKILNPSKIIGIADGVGGISNTKHHNKKINAVKKILKI